LRIQGIQGRIIKLYTGTAIGWDSNIYDDILEECISTNGRHEGIAIIINRVEVVYDNLHPEGLSVEQWIDNLQFHGKLYQGKEFKINEERF